MKQIVDEIMEKLPEDFNMVEIMNKVEERTPYVIVAFQECERMNYLTGEMKRSLKEVELGLKVNNFEGKVITCKKNMRDESSTIIYILQCEKDKTIKKSWVK